MKVILAVLPGRKGGGTARGPPALRIHAGVSRPPVSTRGLIAGPWTPLASLCSAGCNRRTLILAKTLFNHNYIITRIRRLSYD